MIVIKKILSFAVGFVVSCILLTVTAMAARQTELPVKMMEKSHVNSYSAVVTQLEFYDFESAVGSDTTRAYYRYQSLSNYVELKLECYDVNGFTVGTVDFDPYVNYIDVPKTTAMVELMPRNPADDTGTYLYVNYVNVYSSDGRALGICDFQIPVYREVWWYPQATVYSSDGRSLVISPFEVDSYALQGWYTKEYTLYNSLKDLYGQYKAVGDYRSGMDMINSYLPTFKENTLMNSMYALRTDAMNDWRVATGHPIESLGHKITTGFMGAREVEIEFINLYYKKVKEFKVRFDLVDASGNITKGYYDVYRAGEADLDCLESKKYSWLFYSYDAQDITNITVAEIIYEDGTSWKV